MTIKRLHVGPRLSQVAIHGNTMYSAGIVADDPKADAAGQTRQILTRIDEYLAEAGTDKSKLLNVTIWLADINDFAAMNSVWDSWVPTATRRRARASKPNSPRRSTKSKSAYWPQSAEGRHS